MLVEPILQSLHSTHAANIGDSYELSIGHICAPAQHTSGVEPKAPKTFWLRVKEALIDKRLPATQKYMAGRLDIEQPSISDWNKPGGFPEMARVVEIGKMLNVCVEWLYTGRGPKRLPPTDSLAQQLWALWDRLDDATKGEIVGLARGRARPVEANPLIDATLEPP